MGQVPIHRVVRPKNVEMATLGQFGLASNSIPQSLCHHSDLGFDGSGGIQADIFTVTRANELNAHGITSHKADRDNSGWETQNIDRRHEPQIVPEERTDTCIPAEISIRLGRPLHRERR